MDEKVTFVHKVSEDRIFISESLELLEQEKLIRSTVVDRIPAVKPNVTKKPFFPRIQPLTAIATAVAAAVIILFFLLPSQENLPAAYRFVIYRPDVIQAEITGTFTGWSRIPMNRIGASGYWDITVNLPAGEHRFTYILNGRQRFADPTIAAREFHPG
jgi:hypothetical protein